MNKRKYTIVQILPALNTGGVERGVVEISKALIGYFEIRSNISMFLAYAGLDNLGRKTYLSSWICLLKAQNIISGK